MVERRPSLGYQGLIALLAGVMLYMLLSTLAGFWKMGLSLPALLLLTAAPIAYGWLTWRSPWTSLLLTSVGIIGGIWSLRYQTDWQSRLSITYNEALEFWNHVRQLEFDTTFGPNIGLFFLGGIGLAIGLLLMREALGEGRAFWSLTSGGLILVTQWIWYYDRSATAFMLYAILALSLWVVAQAARRDAQWLASGRRVGYKSTTATPIAIILLVALVSAALPSEIAPIDLGTLGSKLQERFPVLQKLRGPGAGGSGGGRFTLRSTGFSPQQGRLGGAVRITETLALNLYTTQPLHDTAYLRGATYSTYTGSRWTNGEIQYIELSKEDEIPSTYGSTVLSESISYKISHQLSMGATVFTMLEPVRVEGLKSGYQVDTDANVLPDRSVARGTPYQVSARLARYSSQQIKQMSTGPAGDQYLPYRQIPATLPDRVGREARRLAAQYSHPYDQASALEAYLRGLPYNLNTPSTPNGRDFVDYFLFDLKQGYCVYSASALAVMLRELGIPTRYVEGFAVPASTPSALQADGTYLYQVRNSQAHAWVESYFQGYGWVTFDPTPRSDLPVPDRSIQAPAPIDSSALGSDPNPNDLTDLDSGGLDGSRGLQDIEGGDAPGAGTTPRDWPWALISLAMVGLVALLGMRRLQSRDLIAATEPTVVVQEAWNRTDGLMHRFNFGRRPGQTATEYAAHLGNQWPNLKEPAQSVALDYNAVRYAPKPPALDPETTPRAREFWGAVREALLIRFGWRRYLWYRLATRRKK